MLNWNAICEGQGGQAIAEAFRNSNPHMQGRALTGQTNFEQIPALAERAMVRVNLFFDMLDERLRELSANQVLFGSDWPSWPRAGVVSDRIKLYEDMVRGALPLSAPEMDRVFATRSNLLRTRTATAD